jgi:hypothetical protein
VALQSFLKIQPSIILSDIGFLLANLLLRANFIDDAHASRKRNINGFLSPSRRRCSRSSRPSRWLDRLIGLPSAVILSRGPARPVGDGQLIAAAVLGQDPAQPLPAEEVRRDFVLALAVHEVASARFHICSGASAVATRR